MDTKVSEIKKTIRRKIIDSYFNNINIGKYDRENDDSWWDFEGGISNFISETVELLKEYLEQKNLVIAKYILATSEEIINKENTDIIIKIILAEKNERIAVELNKTLLERTRYLYRELMSSVFHDLYKNYQEEVSILFDGETDLEKTSVRKGITHKPQILVLKEIGVFDLPVIKNLTLEQKGIFFSTLLNMSFENTKDYIGNIYDTKGNGGNKSPYNQTSIRQATEILALINLPPIK